MASETGTETAAVFRFSLSSISHVEVEYLLTNNDHTVAHVICEFPLETANSECLRGHFSCNDETCILEHYVSDGVIDCPDGTDEVDCHHVCSFTSDATGKKDCYSTAIPLLFHCYSTFFLLTALAATCTITAG